MTTFPCSKEQRLQILQGIIMRHSKSDRNRPEKLFLCAISLGSAIMKIVGRKWQFLITSSFLLAAYTYKVTRRTSDKQTNQYVATFLLSPQEVYSWSVFVFLYVRCLCLSCLHVLQLYVYSILHPGAVDCTVS